MLKQCVDKNILLKSNWSLNGNRFIPVALTSQLMIAFHLNSRATAGSSSISCTAQVY